MSGGEAMQKKQVDEDVELLALTTQKFLSGNPSILVGSGCSVPYGLPTMGKLAEEIVSVLNQKFETEPSWIEFVSQLKATQNLESALEAVAMKDSIHDEIIRVVWECITRCDNSAFLSFLQNGQFPDISKIIAKCVQTAAKTNIITTNYDRLIEYSIDEAVGKCNSGFSGNYIKKFIGFDASPSKRAVNLFKVHGSINWFKNNEYGSTFSMDLKESSLIGQKFSPMIVTPGNRKYKETHNDPFRTVIAEADKAMRESSSYLCIGYGFNDEHIQPIIIDENRSKKKPVVIVTKGITQKMIDLFHANIDYPCLIITENEQNGGATVYFNKDDCKIYEQPFWKVNEFTKLWLG